MAQIVISTGKAVLKNGGLRCNTLRDGDSGKVCGRQLAKLNSSGQIAGNFLCPRCKNHIEVRIAS